jgi:photosystem II stability/assembly factor-like uncharacterized protein
MYYVILTKEVNMKSRILFLLVIALLFLQSGEEAIAQWSGISQLKYTTIKCLLTVNDSTVFLAGDNGIFLRSTDNGTTWTNVMQNGIEVDTLLSLGKGGGYIFAGANGVSSIYRSSNNGNSWSVANEGLPPVTVVNAFTWIDSTLYVAADYGVFHSTDNGGHWRIDTAGLELEQLFPGQYGGIVGITSIRSKKLFAIKSASERGVYTSSADSIDWVPIGLEAEWGNAIAAIDTNVFVGTPGGIYLYTGSGTTWLSRSNGLPNNGQSCILTTADTLLFAYYSGFSTISVNGIFMSSDLGQTWVQINDSIFSGNVVNTMVTTKKYLIAGTQSGAWRLPLASMITSVDDIPIHLPTDYALNQNYPNPFNPSTTITFSVGTNSYTSLRVYDVLGREVATIVSEQLSAGNYSRQWNAEKLPSGIYFYRLQAGKYVETKKMVLLR